MSQRKCGFPGAGLSFALPFLPPFIGFDMYTLTAYTY